LAGCGDNTGRVVDLKTKTMITLKGHTDVVRCIIECEDRYVLTCSDDKAISLWNRLTGECIRTYSGHRNWVFCILYDKKTKRVISASGDGAIIVWNVETSEQIGVMKGHSGGVSSLAFVNETTIVSGSDDDSVKMWDITTMKEIKTMSSHTGYVMSVAVTPDWQFVVLGLGDETVKVSSIATGECITTLSHHSDWVNKVAVSPDGRFIASGGDDKMFYLLSVNPPFEVFLSSNSFNLYCSIFTHFFFSISLSYRFIYRIVALITVCEWRGVIVPPQGDCPYVTFVVVG
jgi:WD40 repeat protein